MSKPDHPSKLILLQKSKLIEDELPGVRCTTNQRGTPLHFKLPKWLTKSSVHENM